MNLSVAKSFCASSLRHYAPELYRAIINSSVMTRRRVRRLKESYLREARESLAQLNCGDSERAIAEYGDAFDKYLIRWSEYWYQYDFPTLSESERAEFISIREMRDLYARVNSEEERAIFDQKERFLADFAPYIRRRWLAVDSNTSPSAIDALLSSVDVILKPNNWSHGVGVELIPRGSTTGVALKEKYCATWDKGLVLEERIVGCRELQSFHEPSLNTVRVVTFQRGGKSVVFGAVLRTGNENRVVDNVHGGGVFAQIDVASGRVSSPGVNEFGEVFENHPYSGMRFVDAVVPHWDAVLSSCLSASRSLNQIPIVGWDVAIRADGEVEFVEGNGRPDFDLMQAPCRVGGRRRVFQTLSELGVKY